MFLAGNRTGKTYSGSMETAFHLTGRYPKWWKGVRFNRPIKVWAATISFGDIREVLMDLYLGGEYESEFGSGSIPKDAIEGWKWNPHAPGVIHSIQVKHASGGISTVTFKSYVQGREKFQGAKVDFIHLDEEPDQEIFSECAMRLAGTGGGLLLTMTPLKGMTETCLRFLEAQDKHFFYIQATWDDNPYLTDDDRAALLAGSEPHLVEARSKGIPALGSGKVFPIEESKILIDPFEIPDHYRRAFGMDFGWTNPTAVVFGAFDPESDTLYIYDAYARSELSAREHSSILKEYGANWIPGVCDPSGGNATQKDGDALLDLYINEGLSLEKADNSVEVGIMRVYQAMQAGKIKIFDTPAMSNWLREFRLYRRDEKGKIVKKDDHLMDATRYLVVSGAEVAKKRNEGIIRRIFRRGSSNWMTA